MIKTVIFDYGGVIKVEHPLNLDLSKICQISEDEVERTKEERILKIVIPGEKGLISDEDYWKGFSEILGKDLPQSPKECVEIAKDIYRKSFVFIPGMIDFVRELKLSGIKTAVLSNTFEYMAKIIRENNGYDEFDPVILSNEIGMLKPDLDIYEFIIEKLQLKPGECIFIDDKERNLIPAREMGIKTVLSRNPEQVIEDVLNIIDSEK